MIILKIWENKSHVPITTNQAQFLTNHLGGEHPWTIVVYEANMLTMDVFLDQEIIDTLFTWTKTLIPLTQQWSHRNLPDR